MEGFIQTFILYDINQIIFLSISNLEENDDDESSQNVFTTYFFPTTATNEGRN